MERGSCLLYFVSIILYLRLGESAAEFDERINEKQSGQETMHHINTVKKRDVLNYISRRNDIKTCPQTPPGLGEIVLDLNETTLQDIDADYPEVTWGGQFSPADCKARHRVAIIVPYRNYKKQLVLFLKNIHPFLMAQQLEYGIYVIEQYGDSRFNKAKLLNIGYKESQRLAGGRWQCFIFHDVALLPINTKNMYSCPKLPKHFSSAIDIFGFVLPYEHLFGGVTGLTVKQMENVNGFSNKYWGWGGEDDDMYIRITAERSAIDRSNVTIGRYISVEHQGDKSNPNRYNLLNKTRKAYAEDGLSSLTYDLVEVKEHHLYTNVLVDVNQRQKRYYKH